MIGWRRTYREEGEGGEGLGSRELVAQQHIRSECGDRHKGRYGIQQEAVKGGNPEGLPKDVQLGLPHFLDSVPEWILQHQAEQLTWHVTQLDCLHQSLLCVVGTHTERQQR